LAKASKKVEQLTEAYQETGEPQRGLNRMEYKMQACELAIRQFEHEEVQRDKSVAEATAIVSAVKQNVCNVVSFETGDDKLVERINEMFEKATEKSRWVEWMIMDSGQNLKKLRKKAKLTQTELATKINVSLRTIQRLEKKRERLDSERSS